MRANICKGCDQQGVNFQNTQMAHITQYERKIQSKAGQKTKQTFLQRHIDGQQAHEKMLISKHQGNTNQNRNEVITLHQSEWQSSKCMQIINTEDEMQRMQRMSTVGWHHQLDGHEFEQAPGAGDGQGSLACCSPWGHKVR